MSVGQVANAIDVLTISNQRYLHCLLSINYYVATLPKGSNTPQGTKGVDGKEQKYLYIVAKRNIKKDEELTFDYRWNAVTGRAPTTCFCAAENCRGTIEL